ncbi:immunoglobulin kappa light chain-like isoform X2 [Solea senegalensis]|uniref:uncharacterized protein LOC122766379 isoform X2 n=1 Tax=Solea senegalensis TaxID=28829 RepID=UPI001C40C88C|nr:uncharacterized protein LOC122766379 isoform X2 [Solea senegalensis]KAG7497719.1 immunoglobulin kappa light chain-like isoform X2 [Solea senegalensis]
MTREVFALCVACVLSGRMAVWTSAEVPSSLRVLSVTVGKEVTLRCIIEDSLVEMIYWYRQKVGEEPQMVSNFYKHRKDGKLTGDFEKNPRFTLETSDKKNYLKISNVQLSDTAIYYCVSGYSLVFTFLEGITVIVEDSNLSLPGLVYQSASERILPGQSVTLRCTVHTAGACDGKPRVYWLKRDKEPLPLIYTDEDGSEECESNTQTPICDYNLKLEGLNLSNAGTYYCAVVSCGHILFGNGTTVEMEDDGHSLDLISVLSGVLAFTILLVVVLACAAYRVYKTNSSDCQARLAAAVAPNMEGRRDADNLHYAAFKDPNRSSLRRRQDDSVNECVYSSVKLSS